MAAPVVFLVPVFGTGPAAEFGAVAVKHADDDVGVVTVIEKDVFEFGFESQDGAEFEEDAEAEDKPGGDIGAGPEPKSVAELVAGCETYHNLSSETVDMWDSGGSLEVVSEPRFGVGFASEAEYMMAPLNIQDDLSEVPTGAQLGAIVVEQELLDRAGTVELGLFAEGMVGNGGPLLGFVMLVLVSTVGVETDPGCNLEGNVEIVL